MPPSTRLEQRLHVQHLAGNPLGQADAVVRALAAVQAQDFAGAKWSLGQRLRDSSDARLDVAFSAGRFLRTHVLRPTWHFVAPDDIHWLLALTAPHVLATNAYRHRELELDGRTLVRCHRVIHRALEGGRHRTRAELGAALGRRGIVAAGQRLAYVMMHAELDRLVCSGALKGKQHTYALLDERAPPARSLPRDEALAALAGRFFRGHGPATLRHFAWWSDLPMKDARTGLELARGALIQESSRGAEWFAGDNMPSGAPAPGAWLIPEYDEVLTGYRELEIPDLPRPRTAGPWQDAFLRPVLVGAHRAGSWRRLVERDRVIVEVNLIRKLEPSQRRRVEAAADRLGRFLGKPSRLEPI